MADWQTLLTFTLACVAIIVVPGPTVTVIIANSLRNGSATGLMNVAGTQLGLAIMIAVLALGLEAVVAFVGSAFFYLKLVGAAYLIWLGIQLWRSDGALGD
ncbi:MAG: LysE family transporter, partial [Pseudomonadota bacterium]